MPVLDRLRDDESRRAGGAPWPPQSSFASADEPRPFSAGRAGYVAAMRRFRILHALSQRLWIIPSLGVLAGIVLSLVTVAIDRRNENGRCHRASSATRRTRSRS